MEEGWTIELTPEDVALLRRDPAARDTLVKAGLLDAAGKVGSAANQRLSLAPRLWGMHVEELRAQVEALKKALEKKRKSKGERKRQGALQRALRPRMQNRGR